MPWLALQLVLLLFARQLVVGVVEAQRQPECALEREGVRVLTTACPWLKSWGSVLNANQMACCSLAYGMATAEEQRGRGCPMLQDWGCHLLQLILLERILVLMTHLSGGLFLW